MDNFKETPDSDKIVEQAKESMRRYVNLNPDPNNYQQLNDRQRQGFATGTKEEREMLKIYERQNPYRVNNISGALGIAEVLLSEKNGSPETIGEIQKLMEELRSSGVNEGKSVTKEQVLRGQELLLKALEVI